MDIDKLLELRSRLHACPERSGQERQTLQAIRAFLAENTDLDVRDMGGWLLAAHFEGEGLPAVGRRFRGLVWLQGVVHF